MAELEGEPVEASTEAQAVRARLNPWWIVGAVIFVLAVILGLRTVSGKKKSPPADAAGDAPA